MGAFCSTGISNCKEWRKSIEFIGKIKKKTSIKLIGK
jgi:hypothetical protein